LIIYMRREGDRICFQARAEGDGLVGDLNHDIGPGESAYNWSYREWAAAEEGQYEFGPHPSSTTGEPYEDRVIGSDPHGREIPRRIYSATRHPVDRAKFPDRGGKR
jgi:hypothetical protein